MQLSNVNTKKIYKDLLDIAQISDPKVVVKLTSVINDINGTLSVSDDSDGAKAATLIIAYLRVMKQITDEQGK